MTVILLTAVLYLIIHTAIDKAFRDLEHQQTRQHTERTINTLQEDMSNLRMTTIDWSAWDDTYTFIQDGNETYRDGNIIPESFVVLRVNLVLYLDMAGTLVLGQHIDVEEEEETPLDDALMESMQTGILMTRALDNEDGVTGIILTPKAPMLVSAQPILNSEGEGPPRGVLVMGRYLDDESLSRMSHLLGHSITVMRLDSKETPEELEHVQSNWDEAQSILVWEHDPDMVCGITYLSDIDGKNAALLRIDLPRDVSRQGEATTRLLLLSLLIVGFVFTVLTLVLLQRFIVSRLMALSETVTEIGSSQDLTTRLKITQTDELSHLAREVNRMLESLEQSAHKQKSIQNVLTNANAEMEQFNRLAVGREQRIIELKARINQLSEELGHDVPYDLTLLQPQTNDRKGGP